MSALSTRHAALLYIALLVTLCIVVIPVTGFAAQKGMLVAFALALSLAFAAWILLRSRVLELPVSMLSVSGIPLVLIALLSLTQTHSLRLALWGVGFETGTVGSLFLFAATVFAASLVPRTSIPAVLKFCIAAVTCSALVSVCIFAAAPALLGGDTLVGSWSGLTYLIGAALVAAAALFDSGRSVLWRSLCGVFTLTLGILFILLFQQPAAILVLIACLCAGGLLAYDRHAGWSFPAGTFVTGAVVLALLLFGPRAPLLHTPVDVHPSLLLSGAIVASVYINHIGVSLIGAGPGTFAAVWNTYRPAAVNTSPYWNTSFDSGYSTAVTFAVTLGMLGCFALLLCAFAVGTATLRYIQSVRGMSFIPDGVFEATLGFAVVVFGSLVEYPVDIVPFVLAAAFCGFCVPLSGSRTTSVALAKKYAIALSLVFFLCACGLAYVSVSQFLAAWSSARAMSADQQAQVVFLERASAFWPVSPYSMATSLALYSRAHTELSDISLSASDLSSAAVYADAAVEENSQSFDAQLYRASLYVHLMSVGYPDAQTRADDALSQAASLAPTRPDLAYVRATADVAENNLPDARKQLQAALQLKPDYTDAQQLLSQIGQ